MAKAIERADFYQIGTFFFAVTIIQQKLRFVKIVLKKRLDIIAVNVILQNIIPLLREYNLNKYEVLELSLHREIKSQRLSLLTAVKYLRREVL